MKAMKQSEMEEFGQTALTGAKKIREYFTYEGSNPAVEKKARIASSAIGAYARLRGTEANLVGNAVKMSKLTETQRKIAREQLEK